VVLADAGRGDWPLCQVTSKPYGDPSSISLSDESFAEGSLKTASFARPGKLFTAATSLIVNEVGLLKPEVMKEIVDAVVGRLRVAEADREDRKR
jgi:mRNA interferase MazF